MRRHPKQSIARQKANVPAGCFAVFGCGVRSPARLAAAVWICLCLTHGTALGESEARIWVPDQFCRPGQKVWVEAHLYRKGWLSAFSSGVRGELLRFHDASGGLVAERLTDASGLARIPLTAGRSGKESITVGLAETPRLRADPAGGTVFIQRPSLPLLFVEVEGALTPRSALPAPLRQWTTTVEPPLPDSRETLKKLSAGFDLVYLSATSRPSAWQVRKWLDDHDFPQAPLLLLDTAPGATPSGGAPPGAEIVETLSQERDRPAYLVTGDPAAAEASARKGIKTYLFSEPAGTPTPTAEEASKERHPDVEKLAGWDSFEPHP
ncbi:MAG: hypothetical protein AB1640_18135 [bacterium]